MAITPSESVPAAASPAVAGVQAALDAGARAAFRHAGGKPPEEVPLLRAFFETSLPDLEAVLGKALEPMGITARIGGLFVHQRPYVAFQEPTAHSRKPACELGDLLVLVRAQLTGPPVYNALLLQGKVGDPESWRPRGGGEADQERLYREWPEIWWRDKPFWRSSDEHSRRHVQPAKPHSGAQYLFIEPGAKAAAETRWRSLEVTRGAAPVAFAELLLGTVLRLSGRRFCAYEKARNRIGWDRLIWDLIASSCRPPAGHRRHGWRYHLPGGACRVGEVPALLVDAFGAGVVAGWEDLPLLNGEEDARAGGNDPDQPRGPEADLDPDQPGGGIPIAFVDLGPANDDGPSPTPGSD